MISGSGYSFPIGLPRGAIAAVAGGMLLLFSLVAAAQNTAPNQPVRQAVPAAAPVQAPGMLDSIGRWFKDSFGFVSSNVEGARDAVSGLGARAGGAAKEAAGAAKDVAKEATDAVARLPSSRGVEGHERCGMAANGAPDCQPAAEAVCRTKGFASGSSLNIQSAKECPARVWISRQQKPGDCKTQSFVTRAVCQ